MLVSPFSLKKNPQTVLSLHLQRVRMTILLRLSTLFLLALSVLVGTASARPQFNTAEVVHGRKRSASPTGTGEYLTNRGADGSWTWAFAPEESLQPQPREGCVISSSAIICRS